MEIVVIIVMLLVGFSNMLKLTYLPVWGRILVCFLCALSIGISWKIAASQSKTQIAAWIQNPELMSDVAVLLTVDVFLQMTFCVMSVKRIFGERMSGYENIISWGAQWIPGILIFPTLFALLVEVIFSFPGTNFPTIAWTLAVAIFVVGTTMSFLLKAVIPEKDLRLELIFMINALIALLGVIATVNGRNAVAGVNSVDWKTLVGVIVILVIGATGGFMLYKRKQNKLNI